MVSTSSSLPIHIRPGNLQTSAAIEAWVHRRLAGAFRRYGAKMTAVEVHFEDVNGPKHGGEDIRCVMEARVNGRIPIAVTARASNLYTAIDAAGRKLDAALRKVVERRHTRARRRVREEPRQDGDALARGVVTGVQGRAPAASEGQRVEELLGALSAGANTITVEEITTAQSMAREVSPHIAAAGIAATCRLPAAPTSSWRLACEGAD